MVNRGFPDFLQERRTEISSFAPPLTDLQPESRIENPQGTFTQRINDNRRLEQGPQGPSALDIDLGKIAEVKAGGGFNTFLDNLQATPEDWQEFQQVNPVDAELMWVEDRLKRLGSSTILPGATRAEQLEAGKYRIERLLSAAPSTGITRAEIQTRASHNPAVALDIGATLAGSGFLPGEAAGSLVLGQSARLLGEQISDGRGSNRGAQFENIGTFMGQFVAGVPRNPTRLYDGIQLAANARRGRGLMSVTGADFAVEEARDLLQIAKGTYKIAGISYNALHGITDATVDAARIVTGGAKRRAINVIHVLGDPTSPIASALDRVSPIGIARAAFDVSGEGFYTPGFNVYEMAKPYEGTIAPYDTFGRIAGSALPQGDERYIDEIIKEAHSKAKEGESAMDLADRMVSMKGVAGFVPKHHANLDLVHTRLFDIFPAGQVGPKIDEATNTLDTSDVENFAKIRVDKVEGRRSDGTPLFLRNMQGGEAQTRGSYIIGLRLASEKSRLNEQGANVYRISIDDAKGTGDAPLSRDNVFELADQMFDHLEDADRIEMIRSRARGVEGEDIDERTGILRGTHVQTISRQDVEAYRVRKHEEIKTNVANLSDDELIRRTRLTRHGIANHVWRNALENTYLERRMRDRNLTTDTSTTKQTDDALIEEYVNLVDELDGGQVDFDSARETRLNDMRKEGIIRGLGPEMDEALQNSPRERAARAAVEPEWDESAVVDREARIRFEEQMEGEREWFEARRRRERETGESISEDVARHDAHIDRMRRDLRKAEETVDQTRDMLDLEAVDKAQQLRLDIYNSQNIDPRFREMSTRDLRRALDLPSEGTLEDLIVNESVDGRILEDIIPRGAMDELVRRLGGTPKAAWRPDGKYAFRKDFEEELPFEAALREEAEDATVIPPESPEALLSTYVNAIENAPLANEADRLDYSRELAILKERLQDHFTLDEIDDAVAAGSGNLPADKFGFRTADDIETTAARKDARLRANLDAEDAEDAEDAALLAKLRKDPATFDEVADQRPDIPTSELDNASDDLHVAEAATRANGGEIPPRSPGDPIGSSPAGDSGPPAQSTWNALRDAFDVPSWEDFSTTFARWWEGARNAESIRVVRQFDGITEFSRNPTWYQDRARELSKTPGEVSALDVIRLGERAPSRRRVRWTKESSLPIFRALHVSRTHTHYTNLSPDQQMIVDVIRDWKVAEENDMLVFLKEAAEADAELWRYDMENFATQMMANPNYFPRGWRKIIQKEGKSIQDMDEKELKEVEKLFSDKSTTELEDMRLGRLANPNFTRRRNKFTFDEMIEMGFEPSSWDPIAMMAQRRLAGDEHREMINLINRLTQVGGIHRNVEGSPQAGWREPKHPLFRARDAVTGSANPADDRPARTGLIVEDAVANWIDKNFGVSTAVSRSGLKKWSNRTKSIKLISSAFQHVDIGSRVLGTAFAPMNFVKQARHGNFPIITVPSLVWDLTKVQFSDAARTSIKQQIVSEDKIKNADGLRWVDVVDAGWEMRGDLSMIQRALVDFTNTRILPESASFRDVAGTIPRGLQAINKFWQTGLFEGFYTVAQKWALENFIIPSIKAQNPQWNNKMVAAKAAENVNVMFSSLGSWQTALRHMSPGSQDMMQAAIFSTNETESLVRAALRAVIPRIVDETATVKGSGSFRAGGRASVSGRKGISIPGTNSKLVMSEHFKQFLDWHLGMLAFFAITANLVHFAATGKPLPGSSYTPFKTDDPYAPFGIGYKSEFMSPQVPFLKGRNGTPVKVDLVGQMDTAFRWALDPSASAMARLNVIPRAGANQLLGQNFMGQPLETAGERIGQFTSDIGAPIAGVNALGAIRESTPGLSSNLPPLETRLGVAGQFSQASGFNLRAEDTNQLKQRMGVAINEEEAEETGKPTTGALLRQAIGPAKGNVASSTSSAPQLVMQELDRRVRTGRMTQQERQELQELVMRELESAVRDSGTAGKGKGWWGVSENDVLLGWSLFEGDARMRKALRNKAKSGGYERKLGPR